MKRKNTAMLFCIIYFAIINLGPAYSQHVVAGKDGNIRNVDTRAVFALENAIYLATKDSLYKTTDMKRDWQPIFMLPSGSNEISCFTGTAQGLYAGTKKGLFRSLDGGATWKNVFKTIIPERCSVLCIYTAPGRPDKIWIGTERGVFASENAGDRWHDISGILKNRPVRCLVINNESVYAGADDGLYTGKKGLEIGERLLVSSAAGDPEEPVPDEMSPSAEPREARVNFVSPAGNRLYAAGYKKILYSDDEAKTWRVFTRTGLSGGMNALLASEDGMLYCATTKGVFEYSPDKERWLELYSGRDQKLCVRALMIDNRNSNLLWALTDKGLYRFESGQFMADQYSDVERRTKVLKIIFDREPAFKELREAAMKYAEVEPGKIKNWRWEARLRALLPKIAFGKDNTKSTNTEIYTSATRDYAVVGPEDISTGWDLSISWELGDLIWSDDQANIDVRSRLTTQLRNDILDDLRRIYYERKRLQYELMNNSGDLKKEFENELRLSELTQAIDDLTGNYLSESIKKKGNIIEAPEPVFRYRQEQP